MANCSITEFSRLELAPEPRKDHRMEFYNGRLILYGGMDDSLREAPDGTLFVSMYNDTWEYSSGEWRKLQTLGSPPQASSSYTSFIKDHSMYVFGGVKYNPGSTSYFNDCYILDLNTNTWNLMACSGDIPCGRAKHAAAEVDGYMYVHGGTTDSVTNIFNTYRLSLSTYQWEKIHEMDPNKDPNNERFHLYRFGHGCAVYDKTIFFFGGAVEKKFALFKLLTFLKFDSVNNKWTLQSEKVDEDPQHFLPKDRVGACVVSYNQYVFMLGGTVKLAGRTPMPGCQKMGCSSDVWRFNMIDKTWLCLPWRLPKQISNAGIAISKDKIYIFGGKVRSGAAENCANDFLIIELANLLIDYELTSPT